MDDAVGGGKEGGLGLLSRRSRGLRRGRLRWRRCARKQLICILTKAVPEKIKSVLEDIKKEEAKKRVGIKVNVININ